MAGVDATFGPERSLTACQIALSATDLRRTHHWYRSTLGLRAAGSIRHVEAPEGNVSGLPGVSLDVWCLVDNQDFFQIEMLEFRRPRMRHIPRDWCVADLGYSSIGLHVRDFDSTLETIACTSGRLLTQPVGVRSERRVCLLDPEGILLELMEDDPSHLSQLGAKHAVSLRSVTLSVRDIDNARRFWIDTLGLEETTLRLHDHSHETLWGLPGARRQATTLRSGQFLLEIVQYQEPVGRSRPAGYLLSDQGILNIALGGQDRSAFDATYAKARSAGYRTHSEPWTVPGFGTVVYLVGPENVSVELLCIDQESLGPMGFIANDDLGALASIGAK